MDKTQREFLKALYLCYKKNPMEFANIESYVKGLKGNSVKSILEFGRKMREKDLIDGKVIDSRIFSAKITMKGIESISDDLKELTLYVMEELMEEGNNLSLTEVVSVRMMENLNHRDRLFFRAQDFANYLKKRELIKYRLIERNLGFNEIIISITPKGKHYYETNTGILKKQSKTKVLKTKNCTGWKHKFKAGKYVDDPIISSYGEYDESGNHTHQIFYNDNGSIRIQFDVEFNERDKPISGEVYMPGNEDQEQLFTKYETEDNVITQTAYNPDGFIVYKQVQKLDKDGRLKEKLWITTNNKIKSKEVYKYSKEGKCIKEVLTSREGKLETIYDENGLKRESLGMDPDGRVQKIYHYVTDRFGNIDEEIKFNMFGRPEYLIKFVYEYYK
ncbi:MAG: hypothetical protein H8D45_25660 [Bacteroidetes bacterium]|nr:hypothetical protein [Bacteroidota bacterium]